MEVYGKALPYMAYDVVGMGEMEARYVKESGVKSPFGDKLPLISANVADFQTGELLSDAPFLIEETPQGLRVGIISVVGDSLVHPSLQEKTGVRLLPAKDVIREHIDELEKRSDIVVLLSHTGFDIAKTLASDFPSIDIILVGHPTGKQMETFEKVGDTIVMLTRSGNKYVGKLGLDISADKRITSAAGEYVAMGKDCGEDLEMVKLIEKHDADLNKYYASSSTQYSSTVPVAQRHEPRDPQPYVSALKCRECHRGQYDAWVQTDHARAFETLRKDHKESDPACAACHTTGFSADSSLSPNTNSRFWGVQCEACHGPGVRHTRKPAKGYGAILESTCRQCHDAERGPSFDFRRDRGKVAAACRIAKQAESAE